MSVYVQVSLVEGTFTLFYSGWLLVVNKNIVNCTSPEYLVYVMPSLTKKSKSCTMGFPWWCDHLNF